MAGRGQETGKAESKAEPFPPLTWTGRRQGQGHDGALGAVEDSDVRRRQRELQQVQRLVKAVHTNPNNGLFNVIGPSLGISGPTPRGYCILGLDGHVLGNADQKAPPPHDEGVRVINIGADLARKVGQPDFDEVKYGLTGTGGEVYGAAYVPPTLRELVYPAHQPGSTEQHPRSGQAKVIGRVALREPNTQQAARILVLEATAARATTSFAGTAASATSPTALNVLPWRPRWRRSSSTGTAPRTAGRGRSRPRGRPPPPRP